MLDYNLILMVSRSVNWKDFLGISLSLMKMIGGLFPNIN